MKKFWISGVMVMMLFACAPQQEKSKAGRDNHALVEQYFQYFNSHNWQAMSAMYTDTAAFKDPSLGPGIVKQSRAEIAAKYAALAQSIPDIQDEVIQTYSAGDKHMVVEFVSRGTAPDSTRFELPICTIFTIENGLISADYTYYDNSDSE